MIDTNFLDIFDDNGEEILLTGASTSDGVEGGAVVGAVTSNNLLLEDLERVMKYTLLQKLEKLCDKMEILAANMAGDVCSKTKVRHLAENLYYFL